MKKIIDHGWKTYNGECYICGCKFTYELEDIVNSGTICPDCGGFVQHYPDEHTRDSKIMDKNTEN